MERTVDGLTLECIRGDITDQPDVEAVVNAANAQLRTGGGVAGAIHRAAGPELTEATRPLAPIEPGEAVLTAGFGLPNAYVIHCLGPVWGQDEPADELLASCYREALARAEEEGIGSVAFPAISTGAFGYPLKEAAGVAVEAVVGSAPELAHVTRVRFVLWGEDDLRIFEETLERVAGVG